MLSVVADFASNAAAVAKALVYSCFYCYSYFLYIAAAVSCIFFNSFVHNHVFNTYELYNKDYCWVVRTNRTYHDIYVLK